MNFNKFFEWVGIAALVYITICLIAWAVLPNG